MSLPFKNRNQNSNPELNQILELVSGLSVDQKIWVSGYLAGQVSSSHPGDPLSSPESSALQQLTILYGSQTGNCKSIAKAYQNHCQNNGLASRLISLADFKTKQLKKESHIVVIVSTHGEGEAPDDAEIFYEDLFASKAPKLEGLKFSVLALGDSSYEKFCQTGRDIDERLEVLGAERIYQRVDCDLDYESDSDNWQKQTFECFKKELEEQASTTELKLISSSSEAIYSRNHPWNATLIEQQKITSNESEKDVFHIELSIEESGLQYQPGDSLAVIVKNHSDAVNSVLKKGGFSEHKEVLIHDRKISLKQALTEDLEISLLNRNSLIKYAERNDCKELIEILEDFESFQNYVSKRHWVDVLQEYPAKISEQEFVELLPKLTPRLYSISSSQIANPEELHLTVSLVASENSQRIPGVASGHLCQHWEVDDTVPVYIETNANFKLPQNGDTPIIMIGAGTGIAPFRAFLQERDELEHQGQNWLIFGNQRFDDDFLYQLEWQSFKKKGLLDSIDLAFSRDQKEKIYVQDRVRQNREKIWEWLENGAHLYICGGIEMAKSVEQELISLIQDQNQVEETEAKNYLKQLKRDNRFQKDVY